MAKPKAQTLQQRFGFRDDDLKTPKHDEIMLWLDENCFNITESLFRPAEWNEEEVKDCITRANTAVSCAKEIVEKNIEKYYKPINDSFGSEWAHERKTASLEKNKKWLNQLNKWTGLGTPPPKPGWGQNHGIVWEEPVTSNNYKSTYTIGFIDLVFCYQNYSLSVENVDLEKNLTSSEILDLPKWINPYPDNCKVCFEVKSTISSLGELIRQVQMYRQHTGGTFVIVSPDDRLAIPLKKQNIHFYKYPF